MTLVLASTSPFRAALLENAGLAFEREAARIDERAVEEPLLKAGTGPDDVAMVLAESKALDVSSRHPGALVLGGDQVLSLDDEILHKAADMEQARRKLLALSGRTHQLSSAIVLAENGVTLWRHVSVAYLTMRPLAPEFIGRYLAAVGDVALKSVGAYQYEGRGIQLFEKVDGDYYTIIGLPMLPLLEELRKRGEIDA